VKALLFVLALIPAFAQAEMFKCVDERGRVTYADKSRPGCKQVDIQGSPPISGGQQGRSPTVGAQEDADFKRRQIERERADEAEKAAVMRRCAALRRELAQLAPGRRYSQINDKGERVYMDDDTRDRKLAELNANTRGCP
jgi:hypothetical protein